MNAPNDGKSTFFQMDQGGHFGGKGNQMPFHERSRAVEFVSKDLQQIRREVETLILQFEQIADMVESIEYEGTTINVREFFQRAISRYQLEREEGIRHELPKKPTISQVDLSGTKILTVEDNEDISTLLTIILEASGAEVIGMSSARRALDLLGKASFTAVVSDIGMPDMNGLEFIRRLRERGDQTPAVALSAYATAKDKQAALDVGFDLFVAKPVHPAKLVMGIARLLTNSP